MENLSLNISSSPLQSLEISAKPSIALSIKREDFLHPEVSGNKFRKLKYNLQEAKKKGEGTLLTFGGAYSNHIAATAAAAKLQGFKSVGVIRGEELGENLCKTLQQNSTLNFAYACGMKLLFISRSEYKEKAQPQFIEKLKSKLGKFYLLPEGGTNTLAVKGCSEILGKEEKKFHYVCCPVGTGGTLAGITKTAAKAQQILGFSALKGNFLSAEISKMTAKENWKLVNDYHFGGYAKLTNELVQFINNFNKNYGIALDPIYTGKMFFGIFDLIEKGYFPENSRILAVHTGGLQGIPGINLKLKKQNRPQIDV